MDPSSAGNLTDISNIEGAKSVLKVFGEQSNILKSISESMKMAFSGRNVIPEDAYSLHMVLANHSMETISQDLKYAKTLAREHNGISIPNTVPKATRADPFPPMNGILGHKGERWAALNAKYLIQML